MNTFEDVFVNFEFDALLFEQLISVFVRGAGMKLYRTVYEVRDVWSIFVEIAKIVTKVPPRVCFDNMQWPISKLMAQPLKKTLWLKKKVTIFQWEALKHVITFWVAKQRQDLSKFVLNLLKNKACFWHKKLEFLIFCTRLRIPIFSFIQNSSMGAPKLLAKICLPSLGGK